MNFPFFIAKRYFVSKKKRNIINIISGIAIAGVAIGTIALVVVLSVYGGFNNLIHSMFNSFDPDLKITAVEGKTFKLDEFDYAGLKKLQGIAYISETLEESAIIEYNSWRDVVTVKGVTPNYTNVTSLDSLIFSGNTTFKREGLPAAVIGLGIAYKLGIRMNFLEPMHLYAAKRGKKVSLNLARSINQKYIYPSGIFSVQEKYDAEYVLVPLEFARELFDVPEKVSSLEIKIQPGNNIDDIQSQVQNITGSMFHVKNKYQQQELIYKVMNSEKWAIYFILVFILIIASFNILGSISMVIIDKKDDIAILRSMGADSQTINRLFLYQGWLITLTGSIIGIISGVIICLVQIYFELLKLPGNGSFAVTAYPVSINLAQLLLTFITVMVIGFFASWIPIRYFSGKYTTQTSN